MHDEKEVVSEYITLLSDIKDEALDVICFLLMDENDQGKVHTHVGLSASVYIDGNDVEAVDTLLA